MNLSSQELRQKFQALGVLLMLDAPKNLEFGIDNISWKIGHKFKGVKLIPLGTHIITYSLSSENNMFPIRQFVNFTNKSYKDQNRIHVFRWNDKHHRFTLLGGQQADGYRQGVRNYHFDAYLGPYPQQNISFWQNNSKYITKQVLDKLDPQQYFINPKEQYQQDIQEDIQKINIDSEQSDNQEQEQNLQKQEQIIEQDQTKKMGQNNGQKYTSKQQKQAQKVKDFGGNIYYSQIPRRLKTEANHTSLINLDKTQLLNKIINKQWMGKQAYILGQLQYSFLCFLIGQCLDSYTQWKQLILLLSYSQQAFNHRKQLMQEFIVVLYEQIKQFPQDFFYDQIGKDNFLCKCFNRLRQYSQQGQINKKSVSRIKKLLEMVNKRFNYQPEQDMEESPVVVAEHQSYF